MHANSVNVHKQLHAQEKVFDVLHITHRHYSNEPSQTSDIRGM